MELREFCQKRGLDFHAISAAAGEGVKNLVRGIADALVKSPNWSSSALFFTYDEHGGYYDHVAPPPAPIPDSIPPMLGPTDAQAAYSQTFGASTTTTAKPA